MKFCRDGMRTEVTQKKFENRKRGLGKNYEALKCATETKKCTHDLIRTSTLIVDAEWFYVSGLIYELAQVDCECEGHQNVFDVLYKFSIQPSQLMMESNYCTAYRERCRNLHE
jgi:hypothetical protein